MQYIISIITAQLRLRSHSGATPSVFPLDLQQYFFISSSVLMFFMAF